MENKAEYLKTLRLGMHFQWTRKSGIHIEHVLHVTAAISLVSRAKKRNNPVDEAIAEPIKRIELSLSQTPTSTKKPWVVEF